MPEPDTNTSMIDPKTLIDHTAIAAADKARDATIKGAHEARLALDAAEQALRSASAAADQAATTGGDLMTAERAVQDAELALRAAQRRARAAEAAAASADHVHRAAIGEAHRAAAYDAIARRMRACGDHDAALAAAVAAKATFALASQDLRDCLNSGLMLHGGLDASHDIRTAEAEANFWRAQPFNEWLLQITGKNA